MRTPDQIDIAYHMPFLREMASHASAIVEIGPGKGNGSTRALAEGISQSPALNKIFVSVDCQDYLEEKPDLPYWHLVLGRSENIYTVVSVALLLGYRPDLIFIDTEHSYDQMKQELATWHALAWPGTTWLFHDTWMGGEYNGIQDAIKEFCVAHPAWEFLDLTRECNGLGMMRHRR